MLFVCDTCDCARLRRFGVLTDAFQFVLWMQWCDNEIQRTTYTKLWSGIFATSAMQFGLAIYELLIHWKQLESLVLQLSLQPVSPHILAQSYM